MPLERTLQGDPASGAAGEQQLRHPCKLIDIWRLQTGGGSPRLPRHW